MEDTFEFHLKASGLLGYIREYRAIPKRKFRFDFAYPREKLLIEIQGGIWTRGAHGRGSGITRDYEKLNLAMKHGWHVLQFDTNAVKSGEAVKFVEEYLEKKKELENVSEV